MNLKDKYNMETRRRPRSEKSADIYSLVLAAFCLIIAVLFFIYGSPTLALIFLLIGGLLILMAVLSLKSQKEENKDQKKAVNNKNEE